MSLQRIITIDILRGFFIFMIIVDHLERFPNGFDFLTGRGLLWMSAAEGFFFLSGMMVGIIRGRKMQTKPFGQVAQTLVKRSLILYAWTIGMTLLFSFIALAIGPNPQLKADVWQGNIMNMLWHTVSLQYVYSWSDFLRYYAVYLFIAIGAIWLLRKNLWWLVVLVSVSVWLFGRTYSEFFTWQILFFGGTLAGWYWQTIITWCKRLPKTIVAIHYPLAIMVIVLSSLVVFGPLNHYNQQLAPLFLRADMPPLRLMVFIILFSAMYRIVRSHEAWFARTVGQFLIPLGQHSLYAYIVHGFIIFFVHLLIPPHTPFVINIIITTITLGCIWLSIKKHFLFKLIPS